MTAIAHHEPRTTTVARPADSHDLGSLSEQQFETALARIETRKVRMQRILDSFLVPEAHFGKPPGMKKPILYRAGADELASAFRLEIVTDPAHPDVVIAEQDFASVTVHRGVLDGAGRFVARTTASCTSKEKRFKRADGTGFVYGDARETLNDLHAMAEKRAMVRLTVSALGLAAWLSAEEEMADSLEEKEKPLSPWTDEEKRAVYKAAADKGLGKKAFLALVQSTLGRDKVGTGDDVVRLYAAIAAWEKPAPAPTPTTESESPTPPVEDPTTGATPSDVEYHETAAAKAAAPDSAAVFGKGNEGPVLPGEIAIAQTQSGELPLGDAPKRRRSNYSEGA